MQSNRQDLQVLTDIIPYADRKAEHSVMYALVNEQLPAEIGSLPIPIPDLKLLLAKWWAISPSERPPAFYYLRK